MVTPLDCHLISWNSHLKFTTQSYSMQLQTPVSTPVRTIALCEYKISEYLSIQLPDFNYDLIK